MHAATGWAKWDDLTVEFQKIFKGALAHLSHPSMVSSRRDFPYLFLRNLIDQNVWGTHQKKKISYHFEHSPPFEYCAGDVAPQGAGDLTLAGRSPCPPTPMQQD